MSISGVGVADTRPNVTKAELNWEGYYTDLVPLSAQDEN